MTMKPVLHSFAYCLDFLREQGLSKSTLRRIENGRGLNEQETSNLQTG
jgi:hypothetical protein